MAYGLPVEGDDGPFVGEQADPVPTCRADQTVADARNVLEGPDAREVVVVAGDDLAVGLVDAERLDGAAHDTPLLDVMAVVPSSVRPSVTVGSLAEREGERALVTTSDGRLVGVAAVKGQQQVEQELDSLMEAVREQFGDREPGTDELHDFLRDRLIDEGRSAEEADRLMAELAGESPS
ncbi:MAG TPA: hypothetical protein VHF24_12085 [Acidimicrobiales bacterium]|nr:hypothetical protein [Acidimicrobiales bacterium]